MDMYGIFSILGVGIVIGVIARLLVPSMQPIGCFMTIICGIVGAAIGLWLGGRFSDPADGFSFVTLILQILAATILVAIVAALFRKSSA